MQAQLDAWADTPVGEGDHGFGYKMPDRFKLEWLFIPSDTIQDATTLSDKFSSREQRKFWRRNENDPRFPAIDDSGIIPASVTEAYLDTLTEKTRSQLSKNISEQLRNPRRGVEEVNGYLVLPEDWGSKRLGFTELATSLQEEFGIDLPTYGSVATWTSISETNDIPVIGALRATNVGQLLTTCQTLISSAKEFKDSGAYRIQEGVASSVLQNSNNDLYLFRITETDPTREPESIDEVRDAVEKDLGRIARWETLQDMIETLARTDGLLAVSVKYGEVINRPQSVSLVDTGIPTSLDPATRRPLMSQSIVNRLSLGQQIADMNSILPTLSKSDNGVIQSIIDRTSDLPIDTPINSLPVEKSTFVIASPENMALVVVRVTGTSPASRELAADFTGGSTSILQAMMSFDELGGVSNIEEVFSFASLADRHNFERGRQTATEEVDDPVAN